MSGATRELKGGVGLTGVVMLGAGTAIGVSIFSVMAPAAQIAGSALLVAVLISALPMIVFALAYAYLASALPKSGPTSSWADGRSWACCTGGRSGSTAPLRSDVATPQQTERDAGRISPSLAL